MIFDVIVWSLMSPLAWNLVIIDRIKAQGLPECIFKLIKWQFFLCESSKRCSNGCNVLGPGGKIAKAVDRSHGVAFTGERCRSEVLPLHQKDEQTLDLSRIALTASRSLITVNQGPLRTQAIKTRAEKMSCLGCLWSLFHGAFFAHNRSRNSIFSCRTGFSLSCLVKHYTNINKAKPEQKTKKAVKFTLSVWLGMFTVVRAKIRPTCVIVNPGYLWLSIRWFIATVMEWRKHDNNNLNSYTKNLRLTSKLSIFAQPHLLQFCVSMCGR